MAVDSHPNNFGSILAKVQIYKSILSNTVEYRKKWHTDLKPMIQSVLDDFLVQSELRGEVKVQDKIDNLESVELDLGRSSSGISENMEDTDVKRTMIKSNGALIYQQLFNGKVMIMVVNPLIEGYGEPKAPITLEILRPEELKPVFIMRHIETFIKSITEWEDYDDDHPTKVPIGFQPIGLTAENKPG
ncbi:MAG: hypothetical protein ABIR66_02145 [Saprospiraceae bacterium]